MLQIMKFVIIATKFIINPYPTHFICGLFNEVVNSSDSTEWNNELERILKRNGRGLLKVLLRHYNTKDLSRVGRS
jgi:hypothetical protein